MAIDVGGWGQQHDGGTLVASDFYNFLVNGLLPIPTEASLPNSDVELPFFFIADAAYPLMENLLKPYVGTNLPHYQENFNQRLGAARKSVECAFGILTMKWRILLTTIGQNPETVNDMVKCMCLLQNIIIDLESEDRLLMELNQEQNLPPLQPQQRLGNENRLGLGKEVRFEVAKYLLNH